MRKNPEHGKAETARPKDGERTDRSEGAVADARGLKVEGGAAEPASGLDGVRDLIGDFSEQTGAYFG